MGCHNHSYCSPSTFAASNNVVCVLARRLTSAVIVCLVASIVSGCGAGNRPRLYPVKGQVFWKGKPAAGAIVYFHAATGGVVDPKDPKGAEPTPMGQVQEDGSFELSTYDAKDGAPAGTYRVSVVWTKDSGRGGDEVENLIPAKFMDPHKSGLPVVEIRNEANLVPAFQLAP